jgi:hypothetical protein
MTVEHEHHRRIGAIETAPPESIYVCDTDEVPAVDKMARYLFRSSLIVVGRQWLKFGWPAREGREVVIDPLLVLDDEERKIIEENT